MRGELEVLVLSPGLARGNRGVEKWGDGGAEVLDRQRVL
jgi:hypothetical protein